MSIYRVCQHFPNMSNYSFVKVKVFRVSRSKIWYDIWPEKKHDWWPELVWYFLFQRKPPRPEKILVKESNGKSVILAEVDHSFPNLVNVLALSGYFLNFVHLRVSSWESSWGWEDLSNQLLSPSQCPENSVDLKARLNMTEVLQCLWSSFDEMEGPVLLSFLLLPILTSSSKEPTPQFHQSSPFQALAQVSGQAPLMGGWKDVSAKE